MRWLSALALDGDGSAAARDVVLPARSILVAAGIAPTPCSGARSRSTCASTASISRPSTSRKVTPERITKPAAAHVLMSVRADGRAISFFGDLHPSFAGNVVKAMASAKRGYPVVSRMLARLAPSALAPAALIARLNDELRATVHAVNRLTPTIVEVVVRAPMAARAFKPGQFYRLQNYETLAQRRRHAARQGRARAHRRRGRSRPRPALHHRARNGRLVRPVRAARAGRAGRAHGADRTPADTPSGETVLLIGGGLGNAVLFSIGQALRANGSRVIYFAGYKRAIDRYKVEEIERAADVIVWCCDEAPGFRPDRAGDKAFVGNIVAALDAYGSGALEDVPIPLGEVDRVVAIGSDGMMAAVKHARGHAGAALEARAQGDRLHQLAVQA